jgi:crossover junction endodeoxyribonuclease RuvC
MSGVSILGVDPGLGGGLAIIHPKDGMLLEPMPTIGNELDLQTLNRFIGDHARDIRVAYLEKVHAMPKNGSVSMFKFGRVYGALEALLVAHKIPVVDVRPQVWMANVHAGISRSLEPKERSRMAFSRIFPEVDARRTMKSKVPDMGLVDAGLIALYGMRTV